MIIKEWIRIPSLSGDKKRRIYFYLPQDYDQGQNRYPVLYMFDGHNVFFDGDATYGKSWGMKEYMDREDPGLIIVAVECNHEGNSRLEEYTPWPFYARGMGHMEAKGERYMEWLVNVLKPGVDRRFRTLPKREHTYICGSSMGGLMSVYALCRYNHIFSKAAALSPSLWVDSARAVQLIRDSALAEDTIIYMDYGSEEMKNHKNIQEALKYAAGAFLDRQVNICMRIVPGGQHCEASWEQQIPVFMKCLQIEARRGNKR